MGNYAQADSILVPGGMYSSGYYGRYNNANRYSFTGNRVSGLPSTFESSRVSNTIANDYSQKLNSIISYIEDGETDIALEEYNKLLDKARISMYEYGYDIQEDQIASRVNDAFEAKTGMSINTAIKESTSSPFWTGVKEGIPILQFFTNKTSSAEAKAQLDGRQVQTKDKLAEAAGAGLTLGAVATVAALTGPIGWAIGGVTAAYGIYKVCSK